MDSLFISFENHDSEVANRLCSYLEGLGRKCWIAPRDIPVGVDYAGEITRAIKSCSALILICSSHTPHSEHVRNEISLAFGCGVMILPYCLPDAVLGDSLEYYLATKHRIYSSEDETKDFGLILDAIVNNEKNLSPFSTSIKTNSNNNKKKPYSIIAFLLISAVLLGIGIALLKEKSEETTMADNTLNEVMIPNEETESNLIAENPDIEDSYNASTSIIQTSNNTITLTEYLQDETSYDSEDNTESKDIIEDGVEAEARYDYSDASLEEERPSESSETSERPSISDVLKLAHSINEIADMGILQVDINTTTETIDQSYLILCNSLGEITSILSPRNDSGLRKNIYTGEMLRKVEYSKESIVMYLEP